jgi:signal peptidase I
VNEPVGKPWKGVVASLFISGAGQFLSGARLRGLIWFLLLDIGPIIFIAIYNLPFVPARLLFILLPAALILWLTMLYDSYRPIKPLKWWGWILLITISILITSTLQLASHAMYHAYRCPTASMKPTIEPGDQVVVSRAAYWFHEPRRGDIAVFDASGITGVRDEDAGEEQEKVTYDKRIVGLPGDRVEILDPEIRINGVEMQFGDPAHPIAYHRRGGMGAKDPDVYVVPKDKYFVLGDNSYNAYDSRSWGYLAREAIRGKVTKIYWPWSRASTPR